MSGRVSSILTNTIWGVVILVMALAITGLQMDRQARRHPGMAGQVPKPFRAEAFQSLARDALAEGDDGAALSYAQDFVRRRPVPAEGLSLLARSYLAAGNQQEAIRALVLSAQRGWRDPFAQLLMANSAIELNDAQTAAQRISALWRLGSRSDELAALTQALLRLEGGMTHFDEGLTPSDSWAASVVVQSAFSGMGLPELATMGKAVQSARIGLDCNDVAGPSRTLAKLGKAEVAQMLWAQLCPGQDGIASDNYAFTQPQDTIGPFAWAYPEHVGLSLDFDRNAAVGALTYENTEHLRVPLARRVTALVPGGYRIEVKARPSSPGSDKSIVLQITCFASDGTAGKAAKIWLEDEPVYFEVPTSQCDGQEIALLVGHGKGRIDSLDLKPASDAG